MTEHYRFFDHPVLDLSPEPTTDLFTEMTRIADELRSHPLHVEVDDQIAFRQLQKHRRPDLSEAMQGARSMSE